MPGEKAKQVDEVAEPERPSEVAEAAQRIAERAFTTRFKKGQSGNPLGRSKFYRECRKLAQVKSVAAMEGLLELALTSPDERVRTVCLIAYLASPGSPLIAVACFQVDRQKATLTPVTSVKVVEIRD